MLILKGTKTVDLSKDELTEIIGQFDRVHIDLGTGDGRNIYKLAINDQNTSEDYKSSTRYWETTTFSDEIYGYAELLDQANQ